MRKALELVVEATDGHEHKKSDLAWQRGALLTARAVALNGAWPMIRRSQLGALASGGDASH